MKRTRTRFCFQISGFNLQKRAALCDSIKSLGGVYNESDCFRADTTHVVCGRLSRGEKFLGALAAGRWILTEDFVTRSVDAGRWLPEEAYEWDPDYHSVPPNTLPCFLTAPRRCRLKVTQGQGHGAFHGWKVALMVDMGKRRTVYKRLLEIGGAAVVTITMPGLTHVILDESNAEIVPCPTVGGSVQYLSPEYLGEFLLQAEPDPTSFIVRPKGISKGSPIKSCELKVQDNTSSSVTMATPEPVRKQTTGKLKLETPNAKQSSRKNKSKVAATGTSPITKYFLPRRSKSETSGVGSSQPNVSIVTVKEEKSAHLSVSDTAIKTDEKKSPKGVAARESRSNKTSWRRQDVTELGSQDRTPPKTDMMHRQPMRTSTINNVTGKLVCASGVGSQGDETKRDVGRQQVKGSKVIRKKSPMKLRSNASKTSKEKENKMHPVVVLIPLDKKFTLTYPERSHQDKISGTNKSCDPIRSIATVTPPSVSSGRPALRPVSPQATSTRPAVKRKILREDIIDALMVVKRRKIEEFRLPWVPTSINLSRQKLQIADHNLASGRISLPLGATFSGIIETCFDEDHQREALDTVLSSLSTTYYPQPSTLRKIITVLQEGGDCGLVSRAYSALRTVLCRHPPTTPALRDMYLQALCCHGNDSQPGQEWQFLLLVIRSALEGCVDCDTENATHTNSFYDNSLLLLQFLVSLLEQDFQDYLYRYKHNENRKKMVAPSMLARIVWPVGQKGVLNIHVKQLLASLFDCLEADHVTKLVQRLLDLLQSLVAMVAECSHLADERGNTSSYVSLGEKASHLAREMAHRLYGSLVDSAGTSLFLDSVQLPWLCCQICQTLLDFYEDSLLAPDPDRPECLTLKTIVSRYLYLIPNSPVIVATKSPHKKAYIKCGSTPVISSQSSPNLKSCRSNNNGEHQKTPNTKMKDVNKKNAKGETALHIACMKNNVNKIKELLSTTGIEVNVKDYAGWTPLHEACNHGNIEAVTELLKYRPPKTIDSYFSKTVRVHSGVDCLVANTEGITPLHDAVINNHVGVVRLLMLYGGTKLLQIKTNEGKTAEEFAWTEEMKSVLRLPPEGSLLTPLRRICVNSSQGSQSSQESYHRESAAIYMPREEVYADTLGSLNQNANNIQPEDCAKYTTIVYHLISSYVRGHKLHLLKALLNNATKQETISDKMSSGSLSHNVRLSQESVFLKDLNNAKVKMEDKVIWKDKDKVLISDLEHYKNDLHILKHLAKHVCGFEMHLKRITDGHEMNKQQTVKLVAMKLLGC